MVVPLSLSIFYFQWARLCQLCMLTTCRGKPWYIWRTVLSVPPIINILLIPSTTIFLDRKSNVFLLSLDQDRSEFNMLYQVLVRKFHCLVLVNKTLGQ